MMAFLAQTEGMGWFGWLWMMLLLGLGFFMILLVLLQRGRGGGLVGALGGAGGQSAFGTRAGDVFTKITVVVATFWVLTAGFGGMALRSAATSASSNLPETIAVPGAPDDLGTTAAPLGELPEMETADDPAAVEAPIVDDKPEAGSTDAGLTAPDLPPADSTSTETAPAKGTSTEDPSAGPSEAADESTTE